MNKGFTGRKHSEETKKKFSDCRKGGKFSEDHKKSLSENNGMKGRSFYDVWVEKYGVTVADEKMVEWKAKKSKANSGKNNPMYGTKGLTTKSDRRSNYQIWLDKFGKTEADRRMEVSRKKTSIATSGKRNPMYGRSPSHEAGLGYSGHYGEFYFRSILELSYLILEIEDKGLTWESAEKKKYRVPYTDLKGVSRTYVSDFVVDNKIIVEVKPTFAMKNLNVKHKAEIAKKYWEDRGYDYIMTDCQMLPLTRMVELFKEGSIVFTGKNLEKFNKFIKNNFKGLE